MTYYTSDNRVFDSFEAARAHCIANPKVSMSRSPAAERYAKRERAAIPVAPTSPTVAMLAARVTQLEAQVAALTAAKQPKRRTKAA